MLLVDIGLNVLAGSGIALAGKNLHPKSSALRSSAVWALVLFEVMVALPIGILLSQRFPSWRLLNLTVRPPNVMITLAMVAPVLGLTGYFVTRRALASTKPLTGWIPLIAGALLTIVAFWVMAITKPIPSESGRSLVPLAYGAFILMIASIGGTAWRVWLLAENAKVARVMPMPAAARDGRTKPLETPRRAGGKR
ncbi:MAG: hypothetical protein H7Z43_06320 [Clostridia bacterium]|nr:hypothetical protein [Deltaproteobacteria bacterium]